jgi:hypothetical protein
LTVYATETEDASAETLAEFPGLPDVPEVLELPEVLDPPEVIDLRDDQGSDGAERRDRPEVPLHRLLDRAKPSLAEAAALAAVVLEALGTMHEAGCAHGDLDSRSVQVGLGGDVRLGGGKPQRPGTARSDAEQRRSDIRAAAGIITEILKSAGRPARPLTDRETRLLARLESATDARSLSRRGLLRAARGLEQVVGPADRRRAARQGIVELIRALSTADAPITTDAHRSAAGGGKAGSAGVAAPPPRSLPPPRRRPPVSPRVWKGIAIAAGVLLILGAEIHFFGDDVKRNVDKILATDAGAAPTEAKQPEPIPNLGPPAAGPVTLLEIRPLAGCRPGAVCETVAQITVTPQDTPLDVAWGFELVDRCGPLREARPGGVFSIPARADRAVQTVSVPVPAGRALALIPVTSSPVKVAGTPIPLSTGDGPC